MLKYPSAGIGFLPALDEFCVIALREIRKEICKLFSQERLVFSFPNMWRTVTARDGELTVQNRLTGDRERRM